MIRLAIILSLLMSSSSNLLSEEVECGGSGNGTKVIYVNGVNWSPLEADKNVDIYIRSAVDPNQIDPEGKVEYILSYNKAVSQDWDLLEAFALFIKNEGGFEENTAFTYAFKWRLKKLTREEYDNLIQKALDSDPILKTSFEEYLVGKEAWLYNLLEEDTQELVNKVSSALIAGDRVLTIGDSQGTLYLNELYRRLERGDIDPSFVGPQDFDFEDLKPLLASVFVAAVVKPINPLSRTVLNDDDIITRAGIFASVENEAEVTFFEDLTNVDPSIEKRSVEEVDRNHSLTETYLNIFNIPHSGLQNLRQFTIDSIHGAAELLPLPCVYCVSEEFPDGQVGVADSGSGFIAETATVTGNVMFQNGAEVCGESVIEVLDDNILVLDSSSLWEVNINVSGVGQYSNEALILNSKLSNLEIHDTSTIARIGIVGSEINGGVIVSDLGDGANLNVDMWVGIYQSTLNNVNVKNSIINSSALSNLSIDNSFIDSISIDAGSGVSASRIEGSHLVNSSVADSIIQYSTIINSDIAAGSYINGSEIVGEQGRSLISGSNVSYSTVTDSTLISTSVSGFSSVTGSSLSGSSVSDCTVIGVNASNYSCQGGYVSSW